MFLVACAVCEDTGWVWGPYRGGYRRRHVCAQPDCDAGPAFKRAVQAARRPGAGLRRRGAERLEELADVSLEPAP